MQKQLWNRCFVKIHRKVCDQPVTAAVAGRLMECVPIRGRALYSGGKSEKSKAIWFSANANYVRVNQPSVWRTHWWWSPRSPPTQSISVIKFIYTAIRVPGEWAAIAFQLIADWGHRHHQQQCIVNDNNNNQMISQSMVLPFLMSHDRKLINRPRLGICGTQKRGWLVPYNGPTDLPDPGSREWGWGINL